jgi:hypothetical protein
MRGLLPDRQGHGESMMLPQPLQLRVADSRSVFVTLVRLRLRYFQQEIRTLIERNLHLAGLVLALAGLPLMFNPEIVGLPLLDLLRPSVSIPDRLTGEYLFFGFTVAWVTLMKPAARGGEFARYLRSMPISRVSGEGVELTMAAAAAGLVWTPVLVSILRVRVFAGEGVDLATAFAALAVVAAVTLGLSRALLAERSAGRVAALLATASTLALLDGQRLASGRTLGALAASLVAALYVLWHPAGKTSLGLPSLFPRVPGRVMVAHSIQLKTLFGDYLGSTMGKLLVASLLAWGAAWQAIHNMQPEAGRVVQHVCLGISLFVLAGLHHPLLESRKPHLRYLRSFPHALSTLRRADHRVILLLSFVVVLTGLSLGGGAAGRAHPGRLLIEASYYPGLTCLAGNQWLLESPQTTLWSLATVALGTACGIGFLP